MSAGIRGGKGGEVKTPTRENRVWGTRQVATVGNSIRRIPRAPPTSRAGHPTTNHPPSPRFKLGFIVRAARPYAFAGFVHGSHHCRVWPRFLREHLGHACKSKNNILRSDDDVHGSGVEIARTPCGFLYAGG